MPDTLDAAWRELIGLAYGHEVILTMADEDEGWRATRDGVTAIGSTLDQAIRRLAAPAILPDAERTRGLDVERLARALPDVMSQETCDIVMGPGHDPLDLAEEWYMTPREMAVSILAALAPYPRG